MPVFHTKTIESILEPVAQQVRFNFQVFLQVPVCVCTFDMTIKEQITDCTVPKILQV